MKTNKKQFFKLLGKAAHPSVQQVVEQFRQMVHEGKTPPYALANIREELRGKNLACFCRTDQPCHCDVLLALANA